MIKEYKICSKCNIEKHNSEFSRLISRGKECLHASCKVCRNKYISDKRKQNPDKERLRKRKQKLKSKYNLTLEEYNLMYSKQEGRCLICGTFYNKLNIDHCHTTGKVRGLLCTLCNTGLGSFKDNSSLLGRAILYLKETNTDKN